MQEHFPNYALDVPGFEMDSDSGQAGKIEGYKRRGVWVPEGLSARDIMIGAKVLEDKHDVAPYISRLMVCDVLKAIKAAR